MLDEMDLYLSLHAPVLLLPQKDSIELKLKDRGQENNRKELLFLSQSRRLPVHVRVDLPVVLFFKFSFFLSCAQSCNVLFNSPSEVFGMQVPGTYCVLGSLVFCFHGVGILLRWSHGVSAGCRFFSSFSFFFLFIGLLACFLPALCMHTPSRMPQVELPIQPAGNLRGFSRSAK